tara:strand:- start:142 stop:543 length:402 start_codon:yes stop_codon:yes gene_type:complete
MYSSYPHIARSFDLKELTVLFDDWEQSGKVICGKIRYQRKTDDCSHEVAFKLLTEELDQNGFPKLQLDWGLKTSVYDLSACIERDNTNSDKIDSEPTADIVEAFGIAVIHTTSEIAMFSRQPTTHIQSSLGHA